MTGWAEKRRIRRRRRERTEEILGWLIVPLLVMGLLWAAIEIKDRVFATATSAFSASP